MMVNINRMFKKVVKIFIYIILGLLTLFIVFYLFTFIFVSKLVIDSFISPYNVKGNIWLLTHASEEDWPAMGTYSSNIQKSGKDAEAILELRKCVERYTRENKPEIVERCRPILDSLEK